MNLDTGSRRVMARYMEEINRTPLLTRDEEQALAVRFRDRGDAHAGRQLVASNLRFVVKICHEYHGYTTKLLDLIQEGNIGLMHAVKKLDPSRGYRLISYAVWWIRAFVQNFIMRSWSLVKLGTTQSQRRLFFKLRTVRLQVERDTGNDASVRVATLAKRFSVSEQDVVSMESRLAGHDFSIDAAVDGSAAHSHAESMVSDAASPEEIVANKQSDHLVRAAVARSVKTLNARQRYIVDHRLMSDTRKTLGEIGAHFQVSRERVRQIEVGIITHLRTLLTAQNNNVARRAAC